MLSLQTVITFTASQLGKLKIQVSRTLSNPQHINIAELFYSIQGESTFAGLPCVFVRLAGCNLRCRYCDAQYTYEEPGTEKTIAELLEFADSYPGALVEITGGEPLLQESVNELMQQLLAKNRTVLLETNGSISVEKVPQGVIKIMDIKCPDSGMHDKMHLENLDLLGPQDEIKFVLSSRNDYDWAIDFIGNNHLGQKGAILFSPVNGLLDAAILAEWILADSLTVRLQLQLHKIIWPDKNRGV